MKFSELQVGDGFQKIDARAIKVSNSGALILTGNEAMTNIWVAAGEIVTMVGRVAISGVGATYTY